MSLNNAYSFSRTAVKTKRANLKRDNHFGGSTF